MNNLNEIPVKSEKEQWTDAQWQAIHASGSDMLVAAAAGSGKTAVLVQRIIEKVLNRNGQQLSTVAMVRSDSEASAETMTNESEVRLPASDHDDLQGITGNDQRSIASLSNEANALDGQTAFDFDVLLSDETVGRQSEADIVPEPEIGQAQEAVSRAASLITGGSDYQTKAFHANQAGFIDIDRLLVMTFTNAAAAEMRERIGMALEAELERNPTSTHLRRQFSLLNKAHISTIHSFCIEVIRSHFYRIDIDPGFRIASDTERSLLLDEAIETLLEREYGEADNAVFLQVVNSFSNDRSDFELTRVLTNLLEGALSHPNPAIWLAQIAASYQEAASGRVSDLAVYPILLAEIDFVLAGAIEGLTYGKQLAMEPNGPSPLAGTLGEDITAISEMRALLRTDWEAARLQLEQGLFRRAPSIKAGSCDPVLKTRVSDLRATARRQVKELTGHYFARPLEHYLQDIAQMSPVAAKLATLVDQLHLLFAMLKKEKNLVDFSDLEHLALEILTTKENGVVKPSEIAREYQEHFVEVLVDEYQDTNNVQEMILQCIKKPTEEAGNLFMVGDVKQSIYRFRLADPAIFTAKYQQFTFIPSDTGLVIDLNQNFRSRSEVVDGVNYIFKRIMSRQIGEVNYDQDASLKKGARFPDDGASFPTELHLLDQAQTATAKVAASTHDELGAVLDQTDDEEAELTAARLETQEMAQAVLRLMADGTEVYDLRKKTYRPLEYRDIVILYRSRTWYADCLESFTELGIPIYAEMNQGYFETTEVSTMLSLLKVIDNPYQDIPLAAVLRSPLVGCTSNQLAEIRLAMPREPFYEAVKSCALNSSGDRGLKVKLIRFLSRLEKWTRDAKHESVAQLIWTVYRETNFVDFVAGLPRGKQRQTNLLGLYTRAKEFENSSFRGIFRFLRFIDRLRERGDDLGEVSSIGEQENVVRVMSVHASKGLEFPVVLIGGLARQFNKIDLRSQYLIDKDLGVAMKYVDTEKRIMRDSLFRRALLHKKQLESASEEMRVLYVAMTRAKERLLLFATVKNAEKNVQRWAIHQQNPEWLLSGSTRANASCYLDWIGPALVGHSAAQSLLETGFSENYYDGNLATTTRDHPSKWRLIYRKVGELDWTISEEVSQDHTDLPEAVHHYEKVDLQSEHLEQVVFQMDWQYPSVAATKFKAKQSVTEIKRMSQEADELAADDLLPDVSEERFRDQGEVNSSSEPVMAFNPATAPNPVMEALHGSEQTPPDGLDEDTIQLSFDVLLDPKQTNQDRLVVDGGVEALQLAEITNSQTEQSASVTGHTDRLSSSLPRPRFMQEQAITPAERGTLMHLVMEHIDLAGEISLEAITSSVDALVQRELITPAQREVINCEQVLQFYQSGIGQQVITAEHVWREMPFSLMVPASEVYPNWQGGSENILVQGVIDCMFLGPHDEIVLVDYKTDRIASSFTEMKPVLQDRYQKQIELYTKAIEQITRKKVSVRCLYFFDDGGNELLL